MVAWDFPRGTASAALLTEFAGELGVPAATVLSGTGLDTPTLRDPHAEVEARQELELVRNLIAATGRHDPGALGLRAGLRYHATAYGIWGYAVTASATVRDAVALALRYVKLTYVFCLPELSRDGALASLSCRDEGVPADVHPFLLARDLAAMLTLVREQAGASLPVAEVLLRLPYPADARPYHDVFGVRPVFGAELTRVTFESRLLDQPMPQANQHTLQLCERQCQELLDRRRQHLGTARRVRDRLRTTEGPLPGMDRLAAELSMTVRTLHRRLRTEGTGYRELVDEARRVRAEDLLATRPLSVEQVAHRLGYSEASSFIHAFIRWKGIPPQEFRRRIGSARRTGVH